MYKLADRYIIIQFISKVIITIMVFVVIFLLVDIVEHLDYIIDSEISRSEMFRYFIYTVPWYTSLGLPMALLLGTVFTMGTLQNNNELSAIKAAGISIKRISVPLIILGIFFSCAAGFSIQSSSLKRYADSLFRDSLISVQSFGGSDARTARFL